MTKTAFVIIILLTALASFQSFSDTHTALDYNDQAIPEFNAEVKLLNFTSSEKVKINKAVELIKKVLVSEEFKAAVLNHEYEGKNSFANNRGLTNLQIYNKILEGSERLSPGVDYSMDVTLVAYYVDAITVGYTLSNTRKIWMNRKFFKKNSPAEVTTNIVHEWLHKLGFGHDVSATASRPYSVPYAVGYIVRRLAKNL